MQWCRVFLFVGLGLLLQDVLGQTDQTDRRLRRREKERYRLNELSRASTAFGVSLYQQVMSLNSDSNVVFSPFSIFTALSMTLLGTEGRTKSELRRVLAQRPRQGIHRALHAVFASFPTSPAANVTLNVANAIYYDDRISLLDTFSRNMRSRYGASPRTFTRPGPEAPVNEWVSRETRGKIQDFLNPGEITPDTMLLLLNAVYFRGNWRDIFDERGTYPGDFVTSSGDIISAQMMSRSGDYSVKEGGNQLNARVLELPYGTDGRFSMFVLMPVEGSDLSDLEARLGSAQLEDAVTNMPEAIRYSMSLPKFKLKLKSNMNTALQALGLSTIFTARADLSRMARAPLAVSKVVHEAVVEVDEKGTTAAAVTGVHIVLTSLPSHTFYVNRPFLFLLRDNTARLNLFMGRVLDPTQES